MLAVLPVAAVLVLTAGIGTAEAGSKGDGRTHNGTPCPSESPSPSPSENPEPSESPEPSTSPSPSESPDVEDEHDEDEPGKGGGSGEKDDESASPSPSEMPDGGKGGETLPETGAETALGGLAGAGTIGVASYMYMRSKRGVLDALRRQ